MTELIPYDLARTALAEAKTFDDVKEIVDRAEAMAVYYRRANDKTLEADAIEIRMFAQRRYGQMLAAQKAQGLLSRGHAGKGRPKLDDKLGGSGEVPPKEAEPGLPTLKDLGISKQFSARAQKLAALPPAVFEAKVATWRAETLSSDRVSTNLLEVGREEKQREARRGLAAALSDTSHELTGARTFPAVYLDPAYARKAGIGDRAYENHYRTEKWADIIAIMERVAPRLQPNAWAFIWIPRAHMLALHPVSYKIAIDDGSIHSVEIRIPLIWAIARALGMDEYSSCFVWTKTDEDHPDEHGTFLLVRDQDEILCLYKKGDGLPRPEMENIYGSNHRERSRPLGHSVKPRFYRKLIADMVGRDKATGRPLPVLELFARFDQDNPLPENWEAWGNQSTSSAGGVEGHPPQATGEAESADVRQIASVESGPAETISEIPQQAPGTTREVPGGPLSGGPSVAGATGEAALSARLRSFDHPEHLRWEGEGGRALPEDDPVIVKPARQNVSKHNIGEAAE